MGIGGITASIIGLALDGLSQRHNAIASNIANADTPGYRPVKVSFEDQLANLITTSQHRPTDNLTISPQIFYDKSLSKMSLDMHTVLLNQNALQYQALISGLDKYMSNIALAVNDGRR